MKKLSAKLTGDIIIQHAGSDRWIVSNVFTRSHIGVDGRGLNWLDALTNGHALKGKSVKLWEITNFSNEESLLADPTRLNRDPSKWETPKVLNPSDFRQICIDLTILIEDQKAYRKRFKRKLNLLDRHHFGNFHQQLGQHLMIKRREEPTSWWPKQKFTENFKSIRPGPYREIEEKYLDEYFSKCINPDTVVLDIGCGTGYFTRKIAKATPHVTGLDPNENYIKIAKKGAKTKAAFAVAPLGEPNALSNIESASIDMVFMSDALLFYFVSPVAAQPEDLNALLTEINRVLRPGSVFVNVESHFQFWLSPWFGDATHPFTILTEYSQRNFYVTPTFSHYIQSVIKFGFSVSWMDELKPDPELANTSNRAYHFSLEFPLWQIFEFKKK